MREIREKLAAFLKSAQQTIAAGNHQATENFCREVLDLDEDNPIALSVLGIVYRCVRLGDHAIKIFERSLASRSTNNPAAKNPARARKIPAALLIWSHRFSG